MRIFVKEIFSPFCDDLFGCPATCSDFKLFVLLVAVVFGPRPQIVITYRADSGPGVVLLIFLFFFFFKVIKSSERWLNPTAALKGWHQGSLLSHKTWNEDVTVNRWKTDFDWQSAAFPFLHMCVVVILVCEPIRADNLTWAPRKEQQQQQQVFHVQVNVSLLWSTHVLCSLYICNTKAGGCPFSLSDFGSTVSSFKLWYHSKVFNNILVSLITAGFFF